MWGLGIIVSIETMILGFIATRLYAVSDQLASLSRQVTAVDKDMERCKQDIGTHDTGIRGAFHAQAKVIDTLEKRVAITEILEERAKKL